MTASLSAPGVAGLAAILALAAGVVAEEALPVPAADEAGPIAVTDVDPAGASLTVTLDGIRPDEGGSLVVLVYRGEEHWLESADAFARTVAPVTADTQSVVFEGLPPDTVYAVQAYHDENENGEFDFRWFPYPKPKEGAGVSNNHTRLGPPEFDKARISVEEPSTRIRIGLRYP